MKLTNVKTTNNLAGETTKILENQSTSKSQKIKELFQLGMETKEIAAKLGIRYNFAYNVISNYVIVEGLNVETVQKETKRDIITKLHGEGKTPKEIAVELKTNLNYIYKIINEGREPNKVEAK